jgi:hypothetical protein
MSITVGDIRELLGEHEGIRAQMRFLARSQKNLSFEDALAKEKIWAYHCGLHDFKEAMQFHIDIDDRIFQSLPQDISLKGPEEEHGEIQKLLNELTELADSTIIDRLDTQELSEYTEKIGLAFSKICELVEVHTRTEDRMLEKALEKL